MNENIFKRLAALLSVKSIVTVVLTAMPYFKRKGNRVKGLGKDGDANWWWERSPYSGNSNYFCSVANSGSASINGASSSRGVAFGFCV